MCTTTQSGKRRGVFVGEVIANEMLCREHYRLTLRLPSFPPTRPGQFVQLQCRPLREQTTAHEITWAAGELPRFTQPELTNKEPMLRRPLSLAARRDVDGGVELSIIYRTIGAGSRWLSTIGPGERLSLLGPLGNGFTLRPEKPLAVLVGGGVGIPPMLYLAERLTAAGKRVVAFCGARTGDLLPLRIAADNPPQSSGQPFRCIEEYSRLGIDSVVATDDGTAGFCGVVSEALRNWFNAHMPPGGEIVVYSCGPEPMMRAVAEICLSRGYDCELALERYMACGMGTCQSCVVKVRDSSERGWSFKLCCADGPVFSAADLLW